MTKKYSSPQAYLNRFFKKSKKFEYTAGEDTYTNKDFRLSWVDGEIFILEKRVIDRSVGADYYEDIDAGELEKLVLHVKKLYEEYEG